MSSPQPQPQSQPGSPPAGTGPFSKPKPRLPRSPAQSAQVRIQNRRREYLERHQEYFDSMDHELADTLLYDSLIRRYQSPAEREAEGRARGYGRILEGSLLRSEAKLELVAASYTGDYVAGPTGASSSSLGLQESLTVETAYVAAPGSVLSESAAVLYDEGTGLDKEQAIGHWRDFIRDRFVRGADEDFDYRPVDEDADLDVMERRDEEDAWFDREDPSWASDGSTEHAEKDKKELKGETGIQDF